MVSEYIRFHKVANPANRPRKRAECHEANLKHPKVRPLLAERRFSNYLRACPFQNRPGNKPDRWLAGGLRLGLVHRHLGAKRDSTWSAINSWPGHSGAGRRGRGTPERLERFRPCIVHARYEEVPVGCDLDRGPSDHSLREEQLHGVLFLPAEEALSGGEFSLELYTGIA